MGCCLWCAVEGESCATLRLNKIYSSLSKPFVRMSPIQLFRDYSGKGVLSLTVHVTFYTVWSLQSCSNPEAWSAKGSLEDRRELEPCGEWRMLGSLLEGPTVAARSLSAALPDSTHTQENQAHGYAHTGLLLLSASSPVIKLKITGCTPRSQVWLAFLKKPIRRVKVTVKK